MYKFCSLCGAGLKIIKDNLACEQCGFVNYRSPRPTATGLVLYKNKLLLTKRAKEPFKNWWDLPGGFIGRSEKAEEAIVRELKEETGLNVKIKKTFGTYCGTCSSGPDKKYSILSIVYILRSDRPELQALDDVSASRWFTKSELPLKIAFDSNQKIIKDFLKIWN